MRFQTPPCTGHVIPSDDSSIPFPSNSHIAVEWSETALQTVCVCERERERERENVCVCERENVCV
jgi:hypothetical protein